MREENLSTDQKIERYRRTQQRAVLVAVAACFLAGGVILGALFSRPPKLVKAGEKEVNAELASAFVEIAKQVEPTVVNISTVSQPIKQSRTNDFSGQSIDSIAPPGEGEAARRANGSGVIVDPQGYILTNQHVIQGADRIKVKLYDGNELPAQVIGSDRETDLAVIKVESPGRLTAARLGDSERMRVGDWVLAIGSPFGLDQTVTAGIISAKERQSADLYKKVGFQYFLQTDAAINRGNSGGPLINLSGEVVGINSAIATSTGDYNGVCFALPTSEAISVYQQLVKQGRVVRGFLGAFTDPVTPQIAKVYGVPVARGAIVSNISTTVEVDGSLVESPAAKAGIKLNDVIVEFQGYKIKDNSELVRRVASTPVGTPAAVKLYRDGREVTLSIVLARRPGRDVIKRADIPAIAGADDSPKSQGIGIRIESLPLQASRNRDSGVTRGVQVVRVEPGSIADDAELRNNDIIEMVNREPVRDKEDFKRVLSQVKSGEAVVLQVYREKLAPFPRIFVSFSKP